MSFVDRFLEVVAPQRALNRAQARAALSVLKSSTTMRYDAARVSNRNNSLRAVNTDADGAAFSQRQRLSSIAQDLLRNTPLAARAQAVIASNVVGDGIIPKVKGGTATSRKALLAKIEAHCDTTAIDAEGRQNLYGLQDLAVRAMVADGEVLIRKRPRTGADGLALPFQLQLLEAAHLDTSRDGDLPNGGWIAGGIVFSPIGRREGYYLFAEHPNASTSRRGMAQSRLVPASEIIHLYRQDRPGQTRGVSWFAPVAMKLSDLEDVAQAMIVRQRIAACFAAFRVNLSADLTDEDPDPHGLESLSPGRIQTLANGEDIRFASPPAAGADYDPFTKTVLREVAAGLGITYEALTGDLSNVNFSSARMGRLEMNRMVSSWQWKLVIPVMLQRIGQWIVEDFALQRMQKPGDLGIDWVPPAQVLVDPTREVPAMIDAIRGGLASRQGAVRSLGFDPERLIEEQEQDRIEAEKRGLRFTSDASAPTALPAPRTDPVEEPIDPETE